MKFFHISDLHLGKRVFEFSMLEMQEDILRKIAKLAHEHRPDAILIAGDVYDKTTPVIEAVQLLDKFLVWLNRLDLAVFVIAGNHDSAERIAFGAKLMKRANVHISPAYSGKLAPLRLADEYGDVFVWMLPYVKPSAVRRFFPDAEIKTYADGVAAVLGSISVSPGARNVLVAHQFVTGAAASDSEELLVGGVENIPVSLFDMFDYVALGHIHRPHRVGRDTLRYSGTPLAYSFSEAEHAKSITVIDLADKGDVAVSTLPLIPMRNLREIRGSYSEIMSRHNYENTDTSDYVRIVLTDEHEEPNAMLKLRSVYPHIMRLEYEKRASSADIAHASGINEAKTPHMLLGEFFEMLSGHQMTDEQCAYTAHLLQSIWNEQTT